MALDALVHTTVAFVQVVLLGHLVCASMSHVVIVANTLLLLVPARVSMQSSRHARSTLPVTWLLLRRWLWLLRLRSLFSVRRFALDRCSTT